MSSGAFVTTKYETDEGVITPLRLQPETIALDSGGTTNDPPSGDVNLSLFAKARKGVREYGIGCRLINISWEGNPPAGYSDDNLSVPILTLALFQSINVTGQVTYLGTTATVISKQPERLR